MYTLAIYYNGPFEVQTLFRLVRGKPPLIRYDINPQLYNPRGFLLNNLGCSHVNFTPKNAPSDKAELEGRIKEMFTNRVNWGKGFRTAHRLQHHGLQLMECPSNEIRIPPESIEVVVKEDNEE